MLRIANLKAKPGVAELPSRRLRPSLSTSDHAISKFVSNLAEEAQALRKRRHSNAQQYEFEKHLTCVIVNCFTAFETNPELWVGYTRGKTNFVKGGHYWSDETNESLLSLNYLCTAIDFLVSRGWMENRVAPKGFKIHSSRMRAAKRLHEKMLGMGFSWAKVSERIDVELLVVKNKEKKKIPWPDPGSFNLAQALGHLARINSNLKSTFINLDVSDDTLNKLARPKYAEEDQLCEVEEKTIDFTDRKLRRIFGLSSFNKGGRFYGGWWQNVPSNLRKHIEIDGLMTVELDFATLQPRILYATAGHPLPADSYLIPDWDKALRPIVKKAFSQLLNSSPSSRHPNQWHRFAPEMNPQPLPNDWKNLGRHKKDELRRAAFLEVTGREYSELLSDLLNYHQAIEADFFSGVWGATQSLDAEIAEKTMINLLSKDIPIIALPIHDSFIVRRGAEADLNDAMIVAFNEVIGEDAKIDRDETVFDPPANYEVKGPIKVGAEHFEELKNHLKSHSQYHIREHEWINQFGPL